MIIFLTVVISLMIGLALYRTAVRERRWREIEREHRERGRSRDRW